MTFRSIEEEAPRKRRYFKPYKPGNERHVRFRARQRAGKACYQLELGAEELEFLIRNLWITEAEVGDRAAVGAAVSRLLSDAARR